MNKIVTSIRRSRIPECLGLFLLTIILSFLVWNAVRLYHHAQQPTDAILVLGGSIQREMHAAQLATTLPDIPILISGGSRTPCLALLFERANADLGQVYSDRCPQSTWGNVYYSTSVLRSWHARHVRLITSISHLPRALWMTRLHLGIHGIWVELDTVVEQGQPGNREYWWKTGVDLIRTLGSALWSLLKTPSDHCPLTQIPPSTDLAKWDRIRQPEKIKCERQGDLQTALTQWQHNLTTYRQQHSHPQ